MPRRKPRYRETPWTPDPEKWRKLLTDKEAAKHRPVQPKGGWQLFRWDTLEDVPQNERP